MDEDSSGLTFVEWYQAQAVDKSQDPAPMIINASQMRVAGFKLDKVIPPQLEAAARSGMRTRGAGLRQLRGMGSERFVLNVDLDTEFRCRCVWMGNSLLRPKEESTFAHKILQILDELSHFFVKNLENFQNN